MANIYLSMSETLYISGFEARYMLFYHILIIYLSCTSTCTYTQKVYDQVYDRYMLGICMKTYTIAESP